MRFGVVLYLVFFAAAGPWACCCPGVFAAAENDREPAAPASCCQTSQGKHQAPTHAPLLPDRPCSCQDERPTAVLPAGAVSAIELAQSFAGLVDFHFDQISTDVAVMATNSLLLPLHEPTDTRRLLAVLRC